MLTIIFWFWCSHDTNLLLSPLSFYGVSDCLFLILCKDELIYSDVFPILVGYIYKQCIMVHQCHFLRLCLCIPVLKNFCLYNFYHVHPVWGVEAGDIHVILIFPFPRFFLDFRYYRVLHIQGWHPMSQVCLYVHLFGVVYCSDVYLCLVAVWTAYGLCMSLHWVWLTRCLFYYPVFSQHCRFLICIPLDLFFYAPSYCVGCHEPLPPGVYSAAGVFGWICHIPLVLSTFCHLSSHVALCAFMRMYFILYLAFVNTFTCVFTLFA